MNLSRCGLDSLGHFRCTVLPSKVEHGQRNDPGAFVGVGSLQDSSEVTCRVRLRKVQTGDSRAYRTYLAMDVASGVLPRADQPRYKHDPC